MKTHHSKYNRKALIGVKCQPSLKADLCLEAERLSISLSSLVENIIENKNHRQLEIADLKKQIFDLNEKLDSYETPYLKKIFKKYVGTTTSYVNYLGETIDITINNIHDVFEIVINSFKFD